MKNYRFPLFVSIAVAMFSASPSFAQADPVGDFNRHLVANWKGDYIRLGQYRVKGTPYLYGESLPGHIVYKGNKSFKNVNILYDLFNQKAGMDVKNEIFEVDNVIEEFSVTSPTQYGSQVLLFKNAANYGDRVKGYLNVLEDGEKVALLKSYNIRLSQDPTDLMNKDKRIIDQFSEYYIYVKASKKLEKVKLKEKEIIKAIGEDKQAKDYISLHKMDIATEGQLISFLESYNNNFK